MSFAEWSLAGLLIVVCLLLIGVILLQRGRGGGLSGAFGGGGGGSSAFGAKTGDVFTWITVVMGAVFLLLAVLANYAFDKSLPPGVTAAPAIPVGLGTTPATPGEASQVFQVETGEDGTITIDGSPITFTTTPATGADTTTGEDAAPPADAEPAPAGTGGDVQPDPAQAGDPAEAADDAGTEDADDPGTEDPSSP